MVWCYLRPSENSELLELALSLESIELLIWGESAETLHEVE